MPPGKAWEFDAPHWDPCNITAYDIVRISYHQQKYWSDRYTIDGDCVFCHSRGFIRKGFEGVRQHGFCSPYYMALGIERTCEHCDWYSRGFKADEWWDDDQKKCVMPTDL